MRGLSKGTVRRARRGLAGWRGADFRGAVSPFDELADTYLFSAHMAKHILFVLVVPALLLLAAPGWHLRARAALPARGSGGTGAAPSGGRVAGGSGRHGVLAHSGVVQRGART